MKTLLHIAEGVVVADVLSRGSRVAHIHAHFVDRATTVAIVASRLLGIGYSATAHANDIYVDPVLLEEKISWATSVVTCTQYNQRYLGSILPDSSNVEVVYHGLDLSRFSGDRDEAPSPMVLSVAQLREKKGLVHLIDAIHAMRGRAIPVRCVIAGDGPLRSELEAQIHDLGLEDVIELKGAIPHDEVIDLMRRAWLFALPAVVASDGDRDGIPNVILEALATGLPVVSTRHSGIPEIVVDGTSGALVPPADPIALSEAMERLIADPETRVELGRRGRSMVIESFDIVRNAERLIATWPTDPDHDPSGDFVPPPPFGKGS